MVVGLKTWGNTVLKQTNDIELVSCITFKELDRHEVVLLENCKDEYADKVRNLKSKHVYSIGAGTGTQIKLYSVFINNVSDIIDTDTALKQEKERSSQAIRDISAEKEKAVKKEFELTEENAKLRDKVAILTRDNELSDKKINELNAELELTNEKLKEESELRQKREKELDDIKLELGTTVIENRTKIESTEESLNKEHKAEMSEINRILERKNEDIKQLEGTVTDLRNKITDLSKKGTIPDINYEYKGDAKIITVIGQGSYGVSNLTYSIFEYLFLQKRYNILLVDLDLKGGNLNEYANKEKDCYTIQDMLKRKGVNKKVIFNSVKGNRCEYAGGVTEQFQPSDIIMLNFDELFAGDYDYIVIDGGIYGGYNIQSKIIEMLMRNGNTINIHIGKEISNKENDRIYNIRNFDIQGIPKAIQLYGSGKSLYEYSITKPIIDAEIKEWIRK